MSTGHDIETRGIDFLKAYLRARGRAVAERRSKTFDLVVDGVDAEVKVKAKPFERLDFIGLTSNQFRRIARETPFKLFLVCGMSTSADSIPEVFEIDSSRLAQIAPKVETHYFFDRRMLEVALGQRPAPPQETRRAKPRRTLLREVIRTKGQTWGGATREVASSDAIRILEALLAERSVAEVVHALDRQGFRGTSFRYLLEPLIAESTRRRGLRRHPTNDDA